MNIKQLSIVILISFIVGTIGTIFFTRWALPKISTATGFTWLNSLVTNSPIVINRHEEVQLNEGVNVIDLIKQSGNITVGIYTAGAAPQFLGNGIMMTGDGLIFTASSVTQKQTQFNVVINDGHTFPASVKDQDVKNGLVVLAIESSGLPTAQLDPAAKLETGQRVIFIGRSNIKFEHEALSALITQSLANQLANPQISTDATVNSDYFGGPIVNLTGHVVGLVIDNTHNIIAEDLQTALSKYLTK
ncbi:MAG TPA: serine protease [Methylomirabilota bacterium]|nr:serine protease [Methylomirabilota bacterium]